MYEYNRERNWLFTDEGTRKFLKVRDHVKEILKHSGAVRMDKAIETVGGDSWQSLACVDRLVELCELREITPPGTMGQYRVFMGV
jgi:hypothetical protein